MNRLTTKQHSRVPFCCLLALLLAMCFLRYALQVNISPRILLAVALVMSCIGDRDELLALAMSCMPLHTSLQCTYVLAACVISYLFKCGKKVRVDLAFVPVLLVILWDLAHCFGQGLAFVSFLTTCIPLVLLLLLMCTVDREIDYDFVVRVLSVCVLASCLCLLGRLLYAKGFNLDAALTDLRRLGLDSEETAGKLISGGNQNPNTLGIQCVLAVTGLMQVQNSGRGKWGDVGLVLFLLVFGALTSSRTYIACLAIMAVLLIFSQVGVRRKLKLLGIVILLALVALLVLQLTMPDLLEYYYGRFQVEDLSDGRNNLFEDYNRFIAETPEVMMFGIGAQNFHQKIMGQYRVTFQVPHNGFQELLIAWGLPGAVLFMLLIVVMVIRSRRQKKKQWLLQYIPFVVLLTKIQVGQMVTSFYTMLAFSYAYLSLIADVDPNGLGKRREKAKKFTVIVMPDAVEQRACCSGPNDKTNKEEL